MSLGAKPYGKPRLPFMISPVVEGGATSVVGDELRVSTPPAAPMVRRTGLRGGESTAIQSSLRVPSPSHGSILGFEPVLCHMTGVY